MANLPRMRDAKGVLAEIQKVDPGSPITMNFIRGLIKSGEIPVVEAGNRKFVNVDLVLDFLASQSTVNPVRYSHRSVM
ncbi:MAG: hypothetical protein HFF51_03330 [Lawsonibacter sp.]|jgi:hypothetical protein|nr:hypothetical protein [Lawsonibacter sp.]